MTGITIEHAQIIDWTQSRGGHPSIQKPSEDADQPVIGFSEEDQAVSWDEWMSVFEDGEWAFIYQDKTPEGELSRKWKIIPRFEPEHQWSCEFKNKSTA